ncbi:uncharacterized protein K02A2.6-like [Bactrocera dorsalis]|uniref:Uncharacterized protein K02A2.6-like n=1 Tax=Bactrocera dorsalis TaxID=27457 RepID=A0ABM3K8F8_BACDO|nr:uncharacterized protein K02A2.6-like [Bactrocera dorsalis]
MSLDDSMAVGNSGGEATLTGNYSTVPRIPLPQMNEDSIEAYFYALEFWFQASLVYSDTRKFHIVLASLPPNKLLELKPIIEAAPSIEKFKYIKQKLTDHFTDSQQRRLQKVLKDMPLGDRKPSELFSEMKRVAGTTLNDSLLNDLWVTRLPPYVQAAVIAAKVPLDEKAQIADSIVESIGWQNGHVDIVSANNDISILKTEIAELTRCVKKNLNFKNDRIRSRSPSRTKRVRHSAQRDTSENFCWYHRKFADKATKCRTGKQPEVANNHRLRIFDPSSNISFLIDTGADVSVIPSNTKTARVNTTGLKLFAANGSPIKVYGEVLLKLNLKLRREFVWNFLIADVSHAIIGADFLSNFGILVDLKQRCLCDSKTDLKSVCTIYRTLGVSVKTINADTNFADILHEFVEITRPPPMGTSTNSAVAHRILTNGQPVFSRPRRLSPEKLTAARAEFDYLLKLGICRPSSSNWSSPLHMVRKADGTWRPCGDYRALNAQTIPDRYPLPFLQDFANVLAGNTIFSKIDLQKAFHQVPVHPDDVCKTAITTPFGLYEFTKMTFGLRNAAQTFQRIINEVFRGLDFVFTYLDDRNRNLVLRNSNFWGIPSRRMVFDH